MNSDAYHYFREPADGLWSWDDEQSILWHDGTTVTFRQELLLLLSWRGLESLPPFEAVILLIAAMRGKLPTADQLWRMRAPIGGPDQAIYSRVQQELRTRVEETVAGLEKVKRLPRTLLSRPMAHIALIELVAEGFDKTSADRSSILEALEDPGQWGMERPPNGEADHMPAIHGLHCALAELTPEQLSTRVSTGCDRLVSAPEIEFAAAVRTLLGKLVQDAELGALARLARDVMAAIYIPRRISELEELPLGGAADISNRGSLDRLLLSELAHEDAVLAARVALNEALYIRREPPAQRSIGSFAVLIDAGIRMWGTPRLFGIAVALALAGRSPSRGGTAFIAKGDALVAVDILSREGLLRAMGTLAPEPDPRAALAAFFAETSRWDNPQRALVTHADTLGDAEFRLALAALPEPILIATVDSDGEFTLLTSDGLRSTPLCKARLDLEALSATRIRGRRQQPPSSGEKPAIYLVRPFPILLPIRGTISSAAPLPNGSFAVLTTSHRLYLTSGPTAGARLVMRESVPGKALVLEFVPALGKVVLLTSAWRDGAVPLYIFDMEGAELRQLRLQVSCSPASAWIDGEYLFLYYRPRVEVVRIDSGELVQNIEVDAGMEWTRGRYFEKTRMDNRTRNLVTAWYILVNDGLAWSFKELIPAPNDIVEIFDRQSAEGPWVLREIGCVQSLADYTAKTSPPPISGVIKAVSKDGERIQLSSSAIIDLSTRSIVHRQLEPMPKIAVFTMRTRWSSISISSAGKIVLFSMKHQMLALEHGSKELILRESASEKFNSRAIKFASIPHGDFKVAEWSSRARALLDSDGLLHLQCDSDDFWEMTIGLCEGAVPIWMASGEACGPKRFIGASDSTSIDAAIQNLERFTLHVTGSRQSEGL